MVKSGESTIFDIKFRLFPRILIDSVFNTLSIVRFWYFLISLWVRDLLRVISWQVVMTEIKVTIFSSKAECFGSIQILYDILLPELEMLLARINQIWDTVSYIIFWIHSKTWITHVLNFKVIHNLQLYPLLIFGFLAIFKTWFHFIWSNEIFLRENYQIKKG